MTKHERIQDFLSGVGVQVRRPQKSLNNNVFLVLNLFYSLQRGSNGFITEKTLQGSNIFHGGGGVQLFPGGGGGVQMLISIETHITCDFPGGGVRLVSAVYVSSRSEVSIDGNSDLYIL